MSAKELELMRTRKRKAQDNTRRKLRFHAVQIACDLFALGLVKLHDKGRVCPFCTGSRAGIERVRRWENPAATVQTLAVQTGRQAHEIQTSLCEYNKYVKWWNGQDEPKPR